MSLLFLAGLPISLRMFFMLLESIYNMAVWAPICIGLGDGLLASTLEMTLLAAFVSPIDVFTFLALSCAVKPEFGTFAFI